MNVKPCSTCGEPVEIPKWYGFNGKLKKVTCYKCQKNNKNV